MFTEHNAICSIVFFKYSHILSIKLKKSVFPYLFIVRGFCFCCCCQFPVFSLPYTISFKFSNFTINDFMRKCTGGLSLLILTECLSWMPFYQMTQHSMYLLSFWCLVFVEQLILFLLLSLYISVKFFRILQNQNLICILINKL